MKGTHAIHPFKFVSNIKIQFFIFIAIIALVAITSHLYFSANISLKDSIEMSPTQVKQTLESLQMAQRVTLFLLLFALLIITLFIFSPLLKILEKAELELQNETNHDYLTGCFNRRSFSVLAKQAIAMSHRYKQDLSIVRLDIDHFKSINSQYGNEVGDQVIKQVAKSVQANCRDSDLIFRFSGQEFVMLLPQTSSSEALTFAQKVNDKIANSPTFTDQVILEVSASGGISQWLVNESDLEKTLNRADRALQLAKENGRNQVLQEQPEK